MVLERNPAFLGASAGNVRRVELLFHQSIAQQLARYEADELDVLWLNDFSGEELARLRQNHPGEYLSSPLLNVIFAVFDASRPPFDDMRVRQAFVHAVDRDALVNGTLGGSANPAQGGYVPYGMPGHSPTIGLRFDPARADELLNMAGYGDRTTFPALRLMAWHGIAPVCDALSAAWRGNLEVQTEWELLDYYKFLRSWNPTRPSIFLFGMSCEFPDAGLMLDNLFSNPFTSWKNLEFLQLFEAAQKNADPVQRLLQIGQADALAMAEAAVMPLYYERMQMLIKPRIRHYPLSPTNWWFWKDVVMES
jgi:ABC-type transport system substrate-binding protein